MLSDRQNKIFKLIIEEYIKTARPVGSNLLCEVLSCSSATVRNEMMELEEAGLLLKTHTSSGRIPSEQGYRYYVDNIMDKKENDSEDIEMLKPIFTNNSLALTDAINKSLEIVVSLTNCTSVILGDSIASSKLKKVEVVPIVDNKLLGIFITDKGYIEHKQLEVAGVSLEDIKNTVDLINKMLEGTYVSDIIEKLEYEIKPVIANYVSQHQAIYEAFYNAFLNFNVKSPDIKYLGKNNIINNPEFNTVDKLKKIITKLDSENIIREISEEENGINIYIGHENEFDEDVTVIKTKYSSEGKEGTIAIIGPKRMEYDRVINMLDYIKKMINEREGE